MKSKQKVTSKVPAVSATPLRHRLIELFWALGPGFTRWAESHMTDGYTPQRVRLMWLLREHGPLKMTDLRDALGVTATNVTALVDGLEEDKMVVRRAHPKDRRATIVALTPKAEKGLSENCAKFKNKVSALFTSFSEKDQEQFVALLARMREALVERGVLEDSDCCSQQSRCES